MFDLGPSPCKYGVTGWCLGGNHNRCPYGPDGQLQRGIWLPECYVVIGHGAKARGFSSGEAVQVVRPSHTYRCPCECHRASPVGQLKLFEAAS
jgi:hypothetical protein